jgi:hypothetical protein
MFKYIFISFLFILFNSYFSQAQITFNANGADIYSSNGSISLSIGELFYLNKGENYNQAEGIQNGLVSYNTTSKTNLTISIYPNPTNDFINIKVKDLNIKNLSYCIYNNAGNELSKGYLFNNESIISFMRFPPAIYLLKIYSAQNTILTYQILKIN